MPPGVPLPNETAGGFAITGGAAAVFAGGAAAETVTGGVWRVCADVEASSASLSWRAWDLVSWPTIQNTRGVAADLPEVLRFPANTEFVYGWPRTAELTQLKSISQFSGQIWQIHHQMGKRSYQEGIQIQGCGGISTLGCYYIVCVSLTIDVFVTLQPIL